MPDEKFKPVYKRWQQIPVGIKICFIVFFLIGLSSCDNPKGQDPEVKSIIEDKAVDYKHNAFRISASKLYSEFRKNRGYDARNKYEGKILIVTGKINSVRATYDGGVEVILYGDNILSKIVCRIQRREREKAFYQFLEYDIIAIRGELINPSLRWIDYPILQNCQIGERFD